MRQFLVLTLFMLSMTGCGNLGGKSGPSEPTPPVPTIPVNTSADAKTNPSNGAVTDGVVSYEKLCASCHGPLEQSRIPKASLDKIKAAIGGVVPEMKVLQGTSDSVLKPIVDELAKLQPGKGKARNAP